MLADELIAEMGDQKSMVRNMGMDIDRYAAEVKDAVRFEIDWAVLMASIAVRESPVDARLRALALTKLPFRSTWFEWAGVHGTDDTPGLKNTATAERPVPRRIGALVQVDESMQRGTIDYAWVQDRVGGLNLCPLRVWFDWRSNPEPVPDMGLTGDRATLTQDKLVTAMRGTKTDSDRIVRSSDDALWNDYFRFGIVLSPYWVRVFAWMHPDGFRAVIEHGMTDLMGEPDILRALIMVLNSRNLVAAEDRPAPERLNKHRARKGRPPLLGYTAIKMRVSRALAQRAGNGEGHASPRLHIVRGHFKIRASGIYWWSPFMRGVGNSARAPSYKVTA